MNRKDLTNQRFGRLIALRPTEERHGSRIVWECQCDCGKKTMVPTDQLINGNVRSCGCLQRENRYKDATGRRIGKLTAIEPVPDLFYGGEPIWRWRCDCGRIVRKTLGQVGNSASTMCPFCRRELNRSQAEQMRKLQNRDPVSGMSPGALESMMDPYPWYRHCRRYYSACRSLVPVCPLGALHGQKRSQTAQPRRSDNHTAS